MLAMNKIVSTVLITIICVLTLQFFFIKFSSPISLLKSVSSIRNFPNKILAPLPHISNKNFEVIEVKTGLKESFTLWFPTVFVRIRNVSNNDIKDKHILKVVIYDNSTSEILDSDYCFISSNGMIFIKGGNKKFKLDPFQFTNSKHKREMKKKSISAKLYLDDDLIGTYPLKSEMINFNKF